MDNSALLSQISYALNSSSVDELLWGCNELLNHYSFQVEKIQSYLQVYHRCLDIHNVIKKFSQCSIRLSSYSNQLSCQSVIDQLIEMGLYGEWQMDVLEYKKICHGCSPPVSRYVSWLENCQDRMVSELRLKGKKLLNSLYEQQNQPKVESVGDAELS